MTAPVHPELEPVCRLVALRTGTALSRQQRDRLARAAASRWPGQEVTSLLGHLQSPRGAHDLAELMSVVSVHKTDLFRDEVQLETLRVKVLSPLAATRRPISVWSAGCATGEEVATLLILLAEVGAAPGSSVLGTDIASGALARAAGLTFAKEAMARVPQGHVARYFVQRGAEWQVAPSLAAGARFARHNLMDEPYPALDGGAGFDVIVCRNVLIYFTPESAELVVGRLAKSLAHGGTLVLAAAEPILKPRGDLEPRRFGNVFFYARVGPPEPPEVALLAHPSTRSGSGTDSAPSLDGGSPLARERPVPSAAPASRPSGPVLGAAPPSAARPERPPPSAAPAGTGAEASSMGEGAFPPKPSGGWVGARPPAPSAPRGSSDLGSPVPRPSAGLMRSLSGEAPVEGLSPDEEGRQLFELVLQWAAAGEPDSETEGGLRKALYLSPDLAAARYMLGLILEHRGAGAEAAAEYRRAVLSLDSGARPTPFFLNNERLRQACRVALERVGRRTG